MVLFFLKETAMPQTATVQKERLPRKSGWSPERRARQAVRIRLWAPWARSTGPKTAAGKMKSAANSYKHGERAHARRLMSKALLAQSRFMRGVNLYIRARRLNTANELLASWSRQLRIEGLLAAFLLKTALADSISEADLWKTRPQFHQKR
jgi:hypothetical protein